MKLTSGFKRLLLWTSALLYASGAACWILTKYFIVDEGYGFQPSPYRPPVLHAHSILGLAFLLIFGYLWSAHIEPGIRQRKKLRSGWTLLSTFVVLFLTVPALFYATNPSTRAVASAVHTWLGAILLAPFLIHWQTKDRASRGRPRHDSP